jgi:hypothetical protein
MKRELHCPIPAAAKYLVKGARSIGYFLGLGVVDSGPLAIQYFERCNSSSTVIPRLNHCIDIAVLGGDAGVGELFPGMDGKTERALKQIPSSENAKLPRGGNKYQ